MATSRAPIPAAFKSAPDVRDPSGSMWVWYTRPAGAVVRLMQETHVTVAHAEWLLSAGPLLLTRRFPDQPSLVLVLDLSRMTERDPAARALILKRAPEVGRRLGCTYVVPPLTMNRLHLMSIHAAAALLRTLAVRVEVRRTLEEVAQQLDLQRADTQSRSQATG